MLKKLLLVSFFLLTIFLTFIFWIFYPIFAFFSQTYSLEYRADLKKIIFFGIFFLLVFILGIKLKIIFLILLGSIAYLVVGLVSDIYITKKWGQGFI